MMPTAPRFDIGDIVYNVESAALGFLEPLQVAEVLLNKKNGSWNYGFILGAAPPTQQQSVVDQFNASRRPGRNIYLLESELATKCEALLMIRDNAVRALAEIDQQLAAAGDCDESG